MKYKSIIAAATASLTIAFASAAKAEDASAFPSHPVRLILPFPAGGGVDGIGRLLAKVLSEKWGQPVVVENMAGATTTLATKAVIDAPPDGYTFGIGVSQLAINPTLFKNMPYQNSEFQLVTEIVEAPLYIGANPQIPAKTFGELIEYAKAHPGEINYASAGPTITNLAVEIVQQDAGVKFKQIPYIGSAQGMTATLSGEVNFTYAIYPVLKAMVADGRLKILANSNDKRSDVLPDVPSIKEFVPSYTGVNEWYGVFVPKDTPKPIVDKLYKDIKDALGTDELKNKFVADGSNIIASSPEEFAVFLEKETARWKAIVEKVGLSLDLK